MIVMLVRNNDSNHVADEVHREFLSKFDGID